MTGKPNRIVSVGDEMYDFATEIFPICRSLTGNGVRETLKHIQEHLPKLKVHEVPSGSSAFDWTIPDEWNIKSARLTDPDGNVIVDFADSNLHILGYSEPINGTFSLEELEPHLYSLPEKPDAIPYMTSYYKRRWGFCLTHRVREQLKPGNYHVQIQSTLKAGHLTYGELILPGETDEEIFLSTYICHPSLANNEISGPVIAIWLAKWLLQQPRRYTYRIVFVPETIGAITYLSRNLDQMKRQTVAGFNLTCMGDERCYSYLPSRQGNTLSDRAALHVLTNEDPDFTRYSYLDRGSDERQYCSPGVDLPVCTVMRSKYCEYPEYHTSLDDLSLITPKGLSDSHEVMKKILLVIENNYHWKATNYCEPQLGKHGFYPANRALAGTAGTGSFQGTMDFLAYTDGKMDVIDIANTINVHALDCAVIAQKFEEIDLIRKDLN